LQVKLWKANYLDNWKCISTLRCDGQEPTKDGGLELGKQGFARLPHQSASQANNWH
jgi:hypothetical protein